MADGRRQSANSRMPNFKQTTQGSGDLDELLIMAVGARVKITTTALASVTLEGTIFTACRITSLVAINTSPASTTTLANGASQPSDYHLVPMSRIQSFELLPSTATPARAEGSSSGFENAQPSIGRIDVKALKAREDAAIRRMKEWDATRGKGVSNEAQVIFDALSRTLPVRWHETSIIVSDAVLITKPYGVENCSAPKDKATALAHVKKVLASILKRIAEQANKAAVATPLQGPRKGG